MKLPTEVFGNVVVVHAPEELGENAASPLLQCLTTQQYGQVVIDLDGVESIESAGLEALLDAQEKLREAGGDLRVATSNHANRKILEITRLDMRLEAFENVVDAVRSFAAAPLGG